MPRRILMFTAFFAVLLAQDAHHVVADDTTLADEKALPTEAPTDFWPAGISYNPDIPTPKSFLGFEIGSRHLTHAQLVGYLRFLASKSSRVSIEQFGRTHGGRPQLMLTIANKKNRQRLDEIRKAHLKLADPASSGQVDVSDLPAVILMGYGVHGDEASATNVSPLVAHYLAAARGDEIDRILDRCIVLLDPSLNPDGFDRFANWVNAFRGRIPSPDSRDAEHNQGWPPGRVNFYWFDLNRDWLPAVHPESRNRLRKYHNWKPNVVLDFHEMGTNSTFFFQPGILKRTNPYTPGKNIELTQAFGAYHARALDQRGSLYFTQEQFDDFYMGKGSTYPDLHGAVGILFEQASSRGLMQRNQDGVLNFHETIRNQFATSLSSLHATTDMRDQLLNFKRQFYQESLEQSRKHGGKTLVFSSPGNRTRLQALADVLLRHDIQCSWVKKKHVDGDSTIAAGALAVPVQQSEYRFLKSLLMRQKNFRENIFYDVSTWCLPLAFNVDERLLDDELPPGHLVPAKIGQKHPRKLKFDGEDIAYLIDWTDDAAPRLAWKLLEAGVRVRAATDKFSTAEYDRLFQAGTLQVHLGTQDVPVARIQKLLASGAKQGVGIFPVKTGLTPTGIDFGSSKFPVLKKPSIATVVGAGISQYEVGELWHMLDIAFEIPIVKLKNAQLSRSEIADFSTIVLPAGSYDLSEAGWSRLEQWVRGGGTVVLTGSNSGQRLQRLGGMDAAEVAEDAATDSAVGVRQKPFNQRSVERALRLISGSIFETQIDVTHPLFFGFRRDRLPVFRNHTDNLPLAANPYLNPGVYTETPLMAGYASNENVAKISQSASVIVVPKGSGRIIAISDNPTFRGFWHGTRRVLVNALFFGQQIN